ncbi:hypothetical protein BDW62DRAFT_9893 [Aspergillus aurantiobrunneus]
MATRRSHKKSRNGCDQCKRRRIKCDEDHPCSHCSRRGMDCTYDNRSSSTPRYGPSGEGIISDIRNRMMEGASPRPPSEDPFGLFNDRIAEGSFFPQEWTAQDPELMHHYTLYTSKTIGRRPEMHETWQVAIPKIAYANEFLMHGILALSALHLAYLKPEQYSFYLAGSGFHMSLGLRSFRKVLQAPNAENCYALFSFSGLIMVYIYASPSDSVEGRSGHDLESILELLGLCRGTLVLLPYMDLLRNSELKPLFLQEFDMHVSEHPRPTHRFPDILPQLINLQHLINTETSPTERESFLVALSRLQSSFEALENADLPLECGTLYMWPIAVDETFFTHLRNRHPVALVLLAFWCAQIPSFSDYWFIGRRGVAWLETVAAAVPPRLEGWLAWPRGVVGGSEDL